MAKKTKPAFTVKVSTPQTADDQPVTKEDFCRYLKQADAYFFIPCREIWPGSSVNARLPRVPVLTKSGKPKLDENNKPMSIAATKWITNNRRVEQATWYPGLPLFIADRLAVNGGWVEKSGTTSFNLYRPPRIVLGDKSKATPWLDHVRKIYPDDADHIIRYLAHHRKHPGIKVNHALVLGGDPGIGKDFIAQSAKPAIGPWNFYEISPTNITDGKFNDFARAVILRINEGRDQGNFDRFKFYDHMKIYTAAPPDVLRCNEKNIKEVYVLNCVGVVITTNYKTDGLYLPANDRRHYVAWSNFKETDFPKDYFNKLWKYLDNRGYEHVAAYLDDFDLTGFDPKASPPKTPAFWDIVHANSAPEDSDLADVLEAMGHPNAVTLNLLVVNATGAAAEWLLDRKNHRSVPHRLDRRGYTTVHNPNTDDGRWKVNGKNQVIYAKANLSLPEQMEAAEQLRAANTAKP